MKAASGLKPRSRKGGLASESVEQLFQRKESVLSKMQLFQFPPKLEQSSKEGNAQLQLLQRRRLAPLLWGRNFLRKVQRL